MSDQFNYETTNNIFDVRRWYMTVGVLTWWGIIIKDLINVDFDNVYYQLAFLISLIGVLLVPLEKRPEDYED